MKLQFNIHYKALWGETMCLFQYVNVGNDNEYTKCVEMVCKDQSEWIASIEITKTETFHYQYAIKKTDETFITESGEVRKINLVSKYNKTEISDFWRVSTHNSYYHSAAFKDCFFKRPFLEAKKIPTKNNLIISINCPQLPPGKYLAVTGNQTVLGNWNISQKVRLNEKDYPNYTFSLNVSEIHFPLEYKYVIVDSVNETEVIWEDGENRCISHINAAVLTILNDENFRVQLPLWRTSGVAIPVFSLRTENSFGIGEFNDLKKMVDWAICTGQRIIQTLPINDTMLYHTNSDSYPYNAVSVYALHPIYLHLESLGALKSKKQRDYFLTEKQKFNQLKYVDYQNVIKLKWEYFRLIYQQESKAIFDTIDYLEFFEKNKEWLVPYAAFSFLRDLNGTPEFKKWKNYNTYNFEEISKLTSIDSPDYDEIALYYYLQYHLHKQLVEAHNYAKSKGVALKGDIPIGVSPLSVDAWVDPQLFNLQVQAGAPPDDFSVTGQNWGFPTYNWELMEKDGFRWWKKRFQKLAEYFDAYRIDHILGFFRIWEIPIDDVWGLKGSFHPALPYTRGELINLGLDWDEERFLKPYLKEHVINQVFGEYAAEVIAKYFIETGWLTYKFKLEFDSQKKIQFFFENQNIKGEKDNLIRDGLYMLHSEVIFVPDLRDADKFHLRISMHSSASFIDLPEHTRNLLDRIYIDYFYHRHNEYWKQQAMRKLPALIKATKMLVCGEDLGMVPDSVPEVMESLEILTLEIERMPKRPNNEFALPSDAPYRSVCTTSTHDMNPVRAWWEENKELTQRFYNNVLLLEGKAPEKCESSIVETIIKQHLDSKAMLIILPWQDWLAIESELCTENPLDERINVPSDPNNVWKYRMHISLEQLLKEDTFNIRLKNMIEQSGR